ncbi:MAG TPA: sigma-70 family RNA polymerase sigma factor [candidate division Zixibacteria bacterium]
MTDQTDSHLVKSFKEGDEKAFNQLVLRHQKKIFDLIYRMTRNREDAADLSLEVFVRAYRNLKDFEERSSFYVWVAKIAVNLSLNFLKREKFRSFLSIFDLAEMKTTSGSPAEDLEKSELKVAIDSAVQSLPTRQRTAFILKHYQDMSHQEIAEVMGTTEGASKANYFQAVQKLQKLLARYH